MNMQRRKGRLSTLAAALVIARRDFAAILLSRSFIFFLLGPLFPVAVGVMAGGVGKAVQDSAAPASIGLAMSAGDNARMLAARRHLGESMDRSLPGLVIVHDASPGSAFDAARALNESKGALGAIVGGSPDAPEMVGPQERMERWRGTVALLASEATASSRRTLPDVSLRPVKASAAPDRHGLMVTAQASQTILFLLTMLLAGMVLSNLVEEKGNKIIEILAAAIPMDAVFLGKLFAMLAVSFVGIAVWAGTAGGFVLLAGHALPTFPMPAVGWPMFFALGIVYFAAAYLLLGSVFLAIGSMASTVREVQTLSMPVTMMQLMVFFLASYAMTSPGSAVEMFALVFPFSSPFAMLARAAQYPALWPHALALVWQAVCVTLFIRVGAYLFRTRVMKSAPGGVRKRGLRGLFRKASTAAAGR